MSSFELELLNALAANTPHYIYAKDLEGRFTFANQSLAERVGLGKPSHMLGKTDFDFYPKQDAEQYFAEEQKIMHTGEPLFSKEEHVHYTLEHKECWLLTTKIPIRNAHNEVVGIMGINFDITPQKKAELDLAETKKEVDAANLALKETVTELSKEIKERKKVEDILRKQVLHDILTGLPNRMLLMERLHNAIHQAQNKQSRFVLMFIDMDRLKFVNDSIGHHAGDEMLKNISDRIKNCIDKNHTLARLAGDEFMLLLPTNFNEEKLPSFIHNILASVSQPMTLGGQSLKLTCSIGCSFYPKDATDPDVLIKMADAAMRQSKVLGGNRFQYYTADFDKNIDDKLEMEVDLKRAVNNKDFILYYQPKLDLKTNKISSVEALIRWQHPTKGFIPPNIFIPLAEEFGLIGDITDWVLRTAVKQAAQWLNDKIPLQISVNLSAYQLSDSGLIQQVSSILEAEDLPPSLIEMEITESTTMHAPEETVSILQRFQEIGIKVSIDDFGTGHSNFSYLHRFPVNALKIDRSFINEMTDKDKGGTIVEAMIAMSHKLQLQVVAEGVETKEQYDLLKEYQCDTIQGFWFAKPMPAVDCEAFYRNHIDQTRGQHTA